MPFCYSPWTNLDISPQGDISPCCKFRLEKYSQQYNIQTATVSEYQNSNLVKKIQQDFINNQWPAGCERCQIEEQNGIQSKRQLDYIRWKDQYLNYKLDQPKLITASIAFGNTCNLTCITCNSYSSSRWQKEYKEIYNINYRPLHFYKKEFVLDFVTQAPSIIHIDIPGGEPFLSGISEQTEMLEHYIRAGRSQSISLHYTTNATVFPEQQWWDLWAHFKEIDIQLSIDDIQKRYEYIRYPASWNTLEENLTQYLHAQNRLNNIKLSISQTVSAFNIFYLGDFFNWIQHRQLPIPWQGRVHSPAHMRPTVWPDQVRLYIKQHLQTYNNPKLDPWIQLLNSDDSDHYAEFYLNVKKHDAYRNNSFELTFPEMAKYFVKK